MAGNIYLQVPFAQKDLAKSKGARWDKDLRLWYIPWALHNQNKNALLKLFPLAPGQSIVIDERPAGIPDPHAAIDWYSWTFPGEIMQPERPGTPPLYIDMIPSTCWFTNVRSAVAPKHWEAVRRAVMGRAGYKCEACHSDPRGQPLECHERWSFTAAIGVQKLVRLVALCHLCHEATHFGLAQMRGREAEVRAHLAQVNGWDVEQVQAHIEGAILEFEDRSSRTWTLDISIIKDAGVATVGPTDGASRAARAVQKTHAVREKEGREKQEHGGGCGCSLGGLRPGETVVDYLARMVRP